MLYHDVGYNRNKLLKHSLPLMAVIGHNYVNTKLIKSMPIVTCRSGLTIVAKTKWLYWNCYCAVGCCDYQNSQLKRLSYPEIVHTGHDMLS